MHDRETDLLTSCGAPLEDFDVLMGAIVADKSWEIVRYLGAASLLIYFCYMLALRLRKASKNVIE